MDFDTYTVVLLVLAADAPELDEVASAALQDAHMAHLAELHEAGHLLAAGPLLGGDGQALRGLSLLRVSAQEAVELMARDPAVQAGRFTLTVLPWMVPRGAVSFTAARFPRSMTEAAGG
ncbi:YciI family protein [Streptomyces sp. V4-01]|uniref:YciI family protein n=1 Tax=Actinacidiphila polyblastidii TaxID=3110430 RepID=A0ABU7PE04_9ACTN|nr:YciI family protein [Streptomyces sp. V4-01]